MWICTRSLAGRPLIPKGRLVFQISSGNRHTFKDAAHDVVGLHFFGFGFKGQRQPVAQHIGSDGFDVVGDHESAVVQEGVGAGRKVEGDGRAR